MGNKKSLVKQPGLYLAFKPKQRQKNSETCVQKFFHEIKQP